MIKNKKGEANDLFLNNFVDIILDFIFFGVLILFLLNQYYKISFLELNYAKNIALLMDNAKPGMTITFDLSDAVKTAKSNGVDINDMIKIQDNKVLVTLARNKGSSYSFFNNVNIISYYPLYKEGYTGEFIFKIGGYLKNEELN
ncbi:hypothetical protein GYA25_03165 [Candidatus Woesearchaeota archaeon]|nr:hypothetical protein [Candidatus Woesearchaeota archaeon]